jgi:hypothetical protein
MQHADPRSSRCRSMWPHEAPLPAPRFRSPCSVMGEPSWCKPAGLPSLHLRTCAPGGHLRHHVARPALSSARPGRAPAPSRGDRNYKVLVGLSPSTHSPLTMLSRIALRRAAPRLALARTKYTGAGNDIQVSRVGRRWGGERARNGAGERGGGAEGRGRRGEGRRPGVELRRAASSCAETAGERREAEMASEEWRPEPTPKIVRRD